MSKKKLWLLVLVALSMVFPAAYTPTADAHSSISNWNSSNHGFFKHNAEGSGWWNVWPSSGGRSGCQGNGNALPTWVNTASEFITFVKCKLGGSTQERVGAAFIISTIIGEININPSASQISEFEGRINYAASKGWINFSASLSCNPGSPPRNTFYQSTRHDVAWYSGCPVNNSGQVMTTYSAITIAGGSSTYIIARLCANPIGSMTPIRDDLDFNMSGTTSVNDTTVNPGQTITFTHSLTNGGPTATSPTSINWTTQKASSSSGSWSTVSSGNAGTFTSGQSKTPSGSTENFTVPNNATPGTQYCRRITWNPDTETGGSQSSSPKCATVQYNYSLTAGISMTLTDTGANVSGIIEPGDSVTIKYTVNNSGPTVSQTVTCTYRQATHVGYSTAAPQTTFTPSGSNCPPNRTFPSNTTPSTTPPTQTATETINTTSLANRSVCRSFTITPTGPSGGTHTATACFHVGTKPYFKVFSGDIMAGSGFANANGSCSLNTRAAIIGWNKGSAGSYAGAGVQYAAQAMHQIFEVATSGAPGGAQPSGHSFANNNSTQNNPSSGRYGGHFGSVQCIPDYFGSGPTTFNNLNGSSSISGTLNGTYYKSNGNLQINGATIAAGTKATVYVDGNVFVSGNITYGGNGSWSVNTIPTFRLIVKGSIFIENDVTQLDGLYVAQPKSSDSLSGRIYTCQTSASPYTPLALGGQLASQCSTKLTVNGAFVADQVWLMRTVGTLRQAAAGDNPGTANIAEVFNLNPAFWISQPLDGNGSGSGQYDSMTSLPPIL